MKLQHRFNMRRHRRARFTGHECRIVYALAIPAFETPSARQVAVDRIVRGCLIRYRIWAHAPAQQLWQDLARVTKQADG